MSIFLFVKRLIILTFLEHIGKTLLVIARSPLPDGF
jgi:hypothetical protein